MSQYPFLPFQRFPNLETASELIELLELHQFDFEVDDFNPNSVSDFATNEANQEIIIKLKQEDFPAVQEIQLELAERDLERIYPDYYLYELTDAELWEVIHHEDEWSPMDYLLAQKILKERGQEISQAKLEEIQKLRKIVREKPFEEPVAIIILAIFLTLPGGIVGALIGWHLNTYQKTVADGERVYGYSAETRKIGKILLWGGGIYFVIISIIFAITQMKALSSQPYYY